MKLCASRLNMKCPFDLKSYITNVDKLLKSIRWSLLILSTYLLPAEERGL